MFLPEAAEIALGSRRYDVRRRVLVMGIVNRTPDSFFDKGAYFELDRSLALAAALVEAGADIIDVGGVRAGPGPEVTPSEEIDRVLPAIEAIVQRFDVAVSVDTFRAEVADAAFRAGAVLGNDISGFADPDYLSVAKRYEASVVATHIRIGPRINDPDPQYPNDDVVSAVESYLTERLAWARAAGLSDAQVILDAGLDLGKSTPQSLELLQNSPRLAAIGPALLLSASNKGFLGEMFDLEVTERRTPTMAALAVGIVGGCRVLRVHDVAGTRRVCSVLEAILNA